MSTVTRQEITACTREAFGSGWVGREQLCAAARAAGARPEAVALLAGLSPHVRVCGLSDLLLLLPDLPDGPPEGGDVEEHHRTAGGARPEARRRPTDGCRRALGAAGLRTRGGGVPSGRGRGGPPLAGAGAVRGRGRSGRRVRPG